MSVDRQSVLVCNAGSSSLKLAACAVHDKGSDILWQESWDGSPEYLCDVLTQTLSTREQAGIVLHRVVHAGLVEEMPQLLDAALLARIAHWAPLAPLHNCLTLQLITVVGNHSPAALQYAVFDSGLYAGLPPVAARYALPQDLSSRWPLRRYGFHGLAHRSQWRNARQACASAALPMPRRLISVQLGSGCSVTTWRDAQAIDTTMGFTPLEGLVMATRSGTIDPGIVLHLLNNEGMTAAQLTRLLTHQSGLAALAEGGDMRTILAMATPEATLAVAHYCQQVRKAIGAALAVLGGVDAITIGGGVGEHQPQVRELVLRDLEELGIVLDQEQNRQASGLCRLHEGSSRAQIWLTPVNETAEMVWQYEQLNEQVREAH